MESQLFELMQATYANVEKFLEPTQDTEIEFISASKKLYDFMQEVETTYVQKNNEFDKLLTDGFDNEQIWQELELQNKRLLKDFQQNVNKLSNESPFSQNNSPDGDDNSAESELENMFEKNDGSLSDPSYELSETIEDSYNENGNTENSTIEDAYNENGNTENSTIEDAYNENGNTENSESNYPKTQVDDKFFRLREMENFLHMEDRKEDMRNQEVDDNGTVEGDEDEIDLFATNSNNDSEEEDNLHYEDFFDPPPTKESSSKKRNTVDNLDESIEENDEQDIPDRNTESKKLSTFEKKQAEMHQKIEKLENENISDKPWQLLGETTGRVRPVNSLLEEHVSFDHTSVGAPVITEETTNSLEDIIKQRIKDQAYDDVERKVKPTTQPFEYKKAPEINQEKSKLSLAEVYEKEYLKEQQTEVEEKENEDHVTISKMMDQLFSKLDALSNFHYTPKPPQPEIKIISNLPSLQMEEVTPITMTDASQLAPEEIYKRNRGDVKGDSEKTSTDRKHERRQKKMKKKFAVKEKERKEKLKAVQNGKVVKSNKRKAIDQLKKSSRATIISGSANTHVKTSNDFFSRLQEQVKKGISKNKTNMKSEKLTIQKKKTHSFKL